jgi:hypothetical protein
METPTSSPSGVQDPPTSPRMRRCGRLLVVTLLGVWAYAFWCVKLAYDDYRLEQCLPPGVSLHSEVVRWDRETDGPLNHTLRLLGFAVQGKPRCGTVREELHYWGAWTRDGEIYEKEGIKLLFDLVKRSEYRWTPKSVRWGTEEDRPNRLVWQRQGRILPHFWPSRDPPITIEVFYDEE